MLIAALSTWHRVGLGGFGALFIAFALVSSFVLPRRSPNFPGDRIGIYLAVCLVLFVGMLTAVVVFGREAKEAKGSPAAAATKPAGPAKTVAVTEKEFAIGLAGGAKTLKAGSYVFDVRNAGKLAHNLTISGPGLSNAATPTFAAGTTAKLTATLAAGTYELYCSVPGHKAAGMDLKVTVS